MTDKPNAQSEINIKVRSRECVFIMDDIKSSVFLKHGTRLEKGSSEHNLRPQGPYIILYLVLACSELFTHFSFTHSYPLMWKTWHNIFPNTIFTIHSLPLWLSVWPRSISLQQGQSFSQKGDSTIVDVWHILLGLRLCRRSPLPAL